MNVEPRVVRIPVGSGSPVTLEADFHTPDMGPGTDGPVPAVVLAHGFAAERTFGLAPVARAFRAAGFAVLVPDYRGFGGSGGEPRLLVDPRRHREDLEAALAWLADREAVDGNRLVLWGASLGGGHALALAARHPELAGVIAVVPHVDGLAAAFRYPLRHLPRAVALGAADLLGSLLAAPPVRVPVVARDGFAALPGREAWEGFRMILPAGVRLPDEPGGQAHPSREGPGDGGAGRRPRAGGPAGGSPGSVWDGRVPARILLKILFDRPGRVAHRIRVPVLVQAAAEDDIIPVEAVRHAAERIERCDLRLYPMDHFGPYREPWLQTLLEEQVAFLRRVTGSGGA